LLLVSPLRPQYAAFNYSMGILRASDEHREAVTRFIEERQARRAAKSESSGD